jgi:hypothetical protein
MWDNRVTTIEVIRMATVIEGTWEEIKERESELAGHRIRLIVDPDDVLDSIPEPTIVRSKEHLVELLVDAMNSPTHEVTAEMWEERRQQIHRRFVSS